MEKKKEFYQGQVAINKQKIMVLHVQLVSSNQIKEQLSDCKEELRQATLMNDQLEEKLKLQEVDLSQQ